MPLLRRLTAPSTLLRRPLLLLLQSSCPASKRNASKVKLTSTRMPKQTPPKPRRAPPVDPGGQREDWTRVTPRPLEDFERTISSRYPGFVDPGEAHRVYCAFYKAAMAHGNTKVWATWEREFIQEHDVKPSFLYEVGVIARSFVTPPAAATEFSFAMRILDAAGEMGHEPAALELGIIIANRNLRHVAEQFEKRATHRIRTIAARGNSPNALFVSGDLYAINGHEEDAFRQWRAALKLGARGGNGDGSDGGSGASGGSFELEILCRLRVAKVLKDRGNLQGAREVLEGGIAWDTPEVCYELAMLDTKHPDARERLTRAAMAGYDKAVAALAHVELEAHKEASASERGGVGADTHFANALEWSNLVKAKNVKDPKDLTVF